MPEQILVNPAQLDPEPEYLYDPDPRRYRRRRSYADPRRRRSHRRRSRLGGLHHIVAGRIYDPARRSYRSRAKGFIHKLLPWVTPGAFVGAMIAQATKNDVGFANTKGFDSWSLSDKIRFVTGTFVERLTLGNVNFIQDLHTKINTGTSKPTFDPANCLNVYTGAGVATWLYSYIPKAPYKGVVKKLSKGLLAGGIIGGLLDEAGPNAVTANPMGASSQINYISNRVT